MSAPSAPPDAQSLPEFVSRMSIELDDVQRRLFDAGLLETAHRVNDAVYAMGYEAARIMEKKHV